MNNQPLFHRAHYNILAAQIKKNYITGGSNDSVSNVLRRNTENLAINLAKRLKLDNPNFDPIKFLEACSPDPELYPLQELWDEEN